MSEFTLRSFVSSDIATALNLWNETPSRGLGSPIGSEDLFKFWQRNPELSRVAGVRSQIAVTAMCGNDGRRGFSTLFPSPLRMKSKASAAPWSKSASQLGHCHVPHRPIQVPTTTHLAID